MVFWPYIRKRKKIIGSLGFLKVAQDKCFSRRKKNNVTFFYFF
jgi:hypothetical protein